MTRSPFFSSFLFIYADPSIWKIKDYICHEAVWGHKRAEREFMSILEGQKDRRGHCSVSSVFSQATVSLLIFLNVHKQRGYIHTCYLCTSCYQCLVCLFFCPFGFTPWCAYERVSQVQVILILKLEVKEWSQQEIWSVSIKNLAVHKVKWFWNVVVFMIAKS